MSDGGANFLLPACGEKVASGFSREPDEGAFRSSQIVERPPHPPARADARKSTSPRKRGEVKYYASRRRNKSSRTPGPVLHFHFLQTQSNILTSVNEMFGAGPKDIWHEMDWAFDHLDMRDRIRAFVQ